jgi:dTDP-4-dehydrorhamnose reductase
VKVLILGGAGMLGHKLWQVLKERVETWATVRSTPQDYASLGLFEPSRLIPQVEATNLCSVAEAVKRVNPHVVINCVGIIKQLREAHDPILSVTINALFPHQLAAICAEQGARLIHISTDCVFSGRRGSYTEDDLPDPPDLYGRSKLLGEVAKPHLTIRTSIIGREISTVSGLVEWFLAQPGPVVRGYTKAIFSGFPTVILAEIIADILEQKPALTGLWHISSEPITKYELLLLLRKAYGKAVEIEPCPEVQIDRSLVSDRFRATLGFRPAAWEQMVERMAADVTPYEVWRKSK